MTRRKEPPASLVGEALAAWNELVTGEEAPGQRAMLEGVAVQIGRARDARRRVDEEGMIIAGDKGAAVPHPALAIERAAQEQVRKWAESAKSRLWMTPR